MVSKRKEIVSRKTLTLLIVIGLFLALLTLLFQFSSGDYSGAAVQSSGADEEDTAVVTGEVYFTVKEKPVTEEGQVVFNVVRK